MDILSNLVENFISKLVSAVCDHPGEDFGQRMQEIEAASHEMIRRMIEQTLNTLDEAIAQQAKNKHEWLVLRKASRTLETVFGSVAFQRRYYRNAQSGETCHLLDLHLGIVPGQRVSNDVRQKAVTEAVDRPYAASGKTACPNGISKASVGNFLSDMRIVSELRADGVKRSVPNLYVEADEDHVALQKGKLVQVKLVYVHEGREEINGRTILKNPRYLTWPLDGDTDTLWEHIASFIENQYDTDMLQHLFLSGDAASWIRTGEEWLPGCIPILDGYHTSKALMALTAHVPKTRERGYKLLYGGDRDAFRQFILTTIQAAPSEIDRCRKRKQANYLLSKWQRIQNRLMPDAQGCSAEGHVSHILSARLSSRPLGWGENNLVTMAQLRVMKANGETISYPSASKRIQTMDPPLVPSKKTLSSVRKTLKSTCSTSTVSLPVLMKGRKDSLYQALHGLSTVSFAS